jgi:hypothetical protein
LRHTKRKVGYDPNRKPNNDTDKTKSDSVPGEHLEGLAQGTPDAKFPLRKYSQICGNL